ncbi:hypothetical protein D6029_16970 [Buttiauxella izardii]|uniref:Uncharacterized protein n=1 Tax=Buttiauxella izardii TaxID=82991 RepID=A0A3A5JUM3_9ENTR|nr:hypothetical protein D6029_16970 [Buttiauxella izardii]
MGYLRKCLIIDVYPSFFKLQGCWLHSQTPVTYPSKLLGICSLAAYLQLELFGYKVMNRGC